MRLVMVMVSLLMFSSEKYQEEIIAWEANKKLTWADFKGKPDHNSHIAAVTASGIFFQISSKLKNNETVYDEVVFAYFSPKNSWYNKKVANNAILGHEQLHFDITALYAKKFKERLKKIDYTNDVKDRMLRMYKQIMVELDSVQKLYDVQTDYSINESSQLIWKLKIEKELKK